MRHFENGLDKSFFEANPIPMWIFDRESFRFLDVNEAAVRKYGYSRAEFLGMKASDVRPREDVARFTQAATGISESLFQSVGEWRHTLKNGEIVDVEVFVSAVEFNSRKAELSMVHDVTEHKRAREALHLSESQRRAVVGSSPDTVLLLDEEWNLVECLTPASYEQITGYAPGERVGRNESDLLHPDDLPSALGILRAPDGNGRVNRAECRIRCEDGSWRWVEATACDMLHDPSVNAIVIRFHDIEERKAAERLLLESDERYKLLVDNSPDSIVVITDGKFAYVNPATLGPMRAESAEQLVGRPITDFIHPDSRETVVHRLTEMIRTRKAVAPADIRLLALDGSVVEVEVRSAPVTYLGKPSVQTMIRNISERRKVEERLHLQAVALNTAANGIVITDRNGEIVWINPAFETLTGYSTDEALGRKLRDLVKSGKQDREFYRLMWNTILAGKVWQGEIVNKKKDGTLYTEDMTIAPVRSDGGEITHFVAVKQDITDRKLLREQLLQSQKLESIGQLAGGVAHDYNNILGVVIGYAELLKSKLVDYHEGQRPVDAILSAATRGADLTRQLLAFARKEMISPRVININSSVESIREMLTRIIGENIDLVFRPGSDLWNIRIDPSQFDQVLINLAANSRDAIKGIGTITIEVSNVSIDDDYVRSLVGLNPGDFVKLSFSDTGSGMDEETAARVFEPFFTTKQKGQGTGLGLSTVYGIVKQNRGNVYLNSNQGEGTTFEIYLPRFDGEVEVEQERLPEYSARGKETILVVEDQAEMLELTKTLLENYGYHILTASSPGEALKFCENYAGTIHLLLTDVIMPVMSGKDLSEKVRMLRPGIKLMYMSGYTANELDLEGMHDKVVEFIQKPFTPAGLAKKVSEVLLA